MRMHTFVAFLSMALVVAVCTVPQYAAQQSPVGPTATPEQVRTYEAFRLWVTKQPVDVQRAAVESSAIVSAGYGRTSRLLDIEFRSGAIYRYREVPESVFTAFSDAPHCEARSRTLLPPRYFASSACR